VAGVVAPHIGVCDRQFELQIELVSLELVHVPDLARPLRASLVRLDRKPLVARLLVHLLVLLGREGSDESQRCAGMAGGKSAYGAGVWRRTAMRAMYSSFMRLIHSSPSRGPALTVSSGSFCTTDLVLWSGPSALRAKPARR
jgi:hypothetical protein